MAFGTALTAATTVSTTAGYHTISLTLGGISVAQGLISSGKLTVCVMSNEYDYEGNEPTSGGDFTRIRTYYTESSQDPKMNILIGGLTSVIAAEGSGNDDDGYIINGNLDDTVDWATLRGDVDTVGATRNDSISNSLNGIYAYHAPGRGSDIIRDIRRSFFVFDLSVLSGTIAGANIELYLDNWGDTGDAAKIIIVQATDLAGSTADFGNCFVADAVTVTDNATFFGTNF